MSPQFVDFDGDGHLDIVAGTYDGSPHLARGDGEAWQQPEPILDAAGERIAIRQYWDHTKKRWFGMPSERPDDGQARGHATSAIAFDTDGDGDFDLLLGDHESGRIWVRRNDGTRTQPAFVSDNTALLAGGKAIDVPGKVATMRSVDWNGDGRLDLLVSSMGEVNSDEPPGGGVFLFMNVGTDTAPAFAAARTLIALGEKNAIDTPSRPDTGLYVDAGDVDGDGDLDLIVGGYSHYKQQARELTAQEQQRVLAIHGELQQLTDELTALTQRAQQASADAPPAERSRRYSEAFAAQKDAREGNRVQRAKLQFELNGMVPPMQRHAFVWLYDNVAKAPR